MLSTAASHQMLGRCNGNNMVVQAMKCLPKPDRLRLPDIAYLIVMQIDLEHDRKFSKSSFVQTGYIIILEKREKEEKGKSRR